RELARPREELATIAGRPCTAFAYCNGMHSPSLVAAVRRAGYTVAVTTRDAPNRRGADPLLLDRKVMWEGHVRGALGGFDPALAALAGAWLLRDRPLHFGGRVGFLLAAFFAWVGASSLWSLWPAMTVDAFLDGMKYFAIFLLIANVVDSRPRALAYVHVVALS